MDFYLDGEVLYKQSFDKTLLRYLNGVDARNVLREVHERICSTHTSRHMIARKIQKGWLFLDDIRERLHRLCQEMS
jgi:hypothetical protein